MNKYYYLSPQNPIFENLSSFFSSSDYNDYECTNEKYPLSLLSNKAQQNIPFFQNLKNRNLGLSSPIHSAMFARVAFEALSLT